MDQTTDPAFETALAQKIDTKTKPPGSLGRIESLAAQAARVQGTLSPQMARCRLVIFAADHGLAADGVSAFPAEVTRQMVLNFARGGAAANVFCRSNGLDLSVVNAGVMGGPFDHPDVIEAALGDGTASSLQGDAMTQDQCDRALDTGRRIGAEGTWDAVACGEMGIGNTSAATLLGHVLTGRSLEDLTGRGTGLDDAGLARKQDILARARARAPQAMTAPQALRAFGGFEIAMMTGAMIGAAAAGRLVLVDGFIATSAALCAVRMAPEARRAMVFCHKSDEAGHGALLDALDAWPLLDLQMRLGEGTGAALAWPLLRASVAMLNDMASFDEAGVSQG